MAQWFGTSWGAPVCDPERHAPTPVGDDCVDCGRPIAADDQGMLIPYAGEPMLIDAYHLDCFLREVGVNA